MRDCLASRAYACVSDGNSRYMLVSFFGNSSVDKGLSDRLFGTLCVCAGLSKINSGLYSIVLVANSYPLSTSVPTP